MGLYLVYTFSMVYINIWIRFWYKSKNGTSNRHRDKNTKRFFWGHIFNKDVWMNLLKVLLIDELTTFSCNNLPLSSVLLLSIPCISEMCFLLSYTSLNKFNTLWSYYLNLPAKNQTDDLYRVYCMISGFNNPLHNIAP